MKFFHYTYKQLNLLVLLLAAFLILLIYRLNITPTLELNKECDAMRAQIEKAENSTVRLQQLKSQYRLLNMLSGNSKLSNEEVRQAILTNTNAYSKSAKISNVKEPHIYTANNLHVVTHLMEMQGNYSELVKIASDFETSFKDARLSAMKLYSTQDNRTKKLTLYAIYYFQNFKK